MDTLSLDGMLFKRGTQWSRPVTKADDVRQLQPDLTAVMELAKLKQGLKDLLERYA